jgi:hypothetical protein
MTVDVMTADEMSEAKMTLDEMPHNFEFGCEEKKTVSK